MGQFKVANPSSDMFLEGLRFLSFSFRYPILDTVNHNKSSTSVSRHVVLLWNVYK